MELMGEAFEVTADQAMTMAKGLYALAGVDGHDEREGILIASLWQDAMGGTQPLPLKEMQGAAGITPGELAKGLPTAELRRLFMKTAILLSWADSKVSPEEKTWIEKTAQGLGIDAKALARLDELVRTWLLQQVSHLSNTDATKEVAKTLGFK